MTLTKATRIADYAADATCRRNEMETTIETARSTRDLAILAALTERANARIVNDGFDDGDEFGIRRLDSGLMAVSYKTGNLNGMPQRSGIFAGIRSFFNLTKLDSGEPIAYTDEGKAFEASYLAEWA